MTKLEVNIGSQYGRLTVIKEVERKNNHKNFECRCECGTIKNIRKDKLVNGITISCGCFRLELAKLMGKQAYERNLKPHDFKSGQTPHNFVDGDNSKINKSECYYIARTWQGIKQRCYNPNDRAYKWYGGRGIEMYKPWINNRPLFKQWILENLGHRPEGYSIDRINSNGNYEPGNLRWADKQTQIENRRNVKSSKY